MKIIVKIRNKSIEVDAEESWTFRKLRNVIMRQEDFGDSTIKFQFKNKFVNINSKITDIGLTEGCELDTFIAKKEKAIVKEETEKTQIFDEKSSTSKPKRAPVNTNPSMPSSQFHFGPRKKIPGMFDGPGFRPTPRDDDQRFITYVKQEEFVPTDKEIYEFFDFNPETDTPKEIKEYMVKSGIEKIRKGLTKCGGIYLFKAKKSMVSKKSIQRVFGKPQEHKTKESTDEAKSGG